MPSREKLQEFTAWCAQHAADEEMGRHPELLACRSRRLGIRDDAGLDTLLPAVETGETSATQRLLCLLTTKFTGRRCDRELLQWILP